jgi:hypothetical protein
LRFPAGRRAISPGRPAALDEASACHVIDDIAGEAEAMTSYYAGDARLMAEGTVQVEIPGATAISVWDATIWQRDSGAAWRIAVDISTPLPPR